MSFISALVSGHFVVALSIYAVAIILVELLVKKLHAAVHDVDVTAWIIESITLPLARAAAITLFLITAYPVLFGLTTAPPLNEILFFREGRLTTLVNLTFILSLLLPLVPVIGKKRSIILPLQGVAISALMFHWMASYMGVAHSYWPGAFNLMLIVLFVAIASPLARQITYIVGQKADKLSDREGSGELIYEGLLLFLQAPAILIYTISLGKQLT